MEDRSFEELRGYLFSLAYRMLGSVAEAEDVVQEAYVRWRKAPPDLESPKAFLSKVTTRLCIDHLKSARVRRENYVGPWLPEPLLTDDAAGPEESAERSDSLSMAFLVVLETLNPTERAVFLLREVFEYDYDEVGEIVGISAVNARQITHRAKQHIASRRPRFSATQKQREELTYRFLAASALGDIEALVEVLTNDVALYSDGGGKARAARRPILGAEKVARFIVGIVRKAPSNVTTRIATVNGEPAIALYEDERPTSVLTMDIGKDGIREVHIVVNPDKLARYGGSTDASPEPAGDRDRAGDDREGEHRRTEPAPVEEPVQGPGGEKT